MELTCQNQGKCGHSPVENAMCATGASPAFTQGSKHGCGTFREATHVAFHMQESYLKSPVLSSKYLQICIQL